MTEALQPLQRALRSQTQGNAPRTAASTPPQWRPATPQLNPPPRGAWQNQQQRNGQGFRGGNATQSGGTSRGFSSRRVETMTTTDHRHHRTCSGTNGSSSKVLPPRLCLLLHVGVQDVICVVTDVVTRRFTDELAPYRLISVAYRLLGTVSVTVEPPQT